MKAALLNTAVFAPADRLGQRIIATWRYIVRVIGLFFLSARQLFLLLMLSRRQAGRRFESLMRITAQQVYFTGVQSLGVVTLLGFILGSVIVLQSIAQLSKLGGVDELGSLIVVTLIRDVGPLLTILIAIARSATAVAAELATMKVNREVDAIEGLGVSLMEYIIAPRILGGTISVVCTSVWFSTVGIIGGYLVSALTLKLHWSFFMDHLLVAITVPDLMLFVFKTFVGGAVVFAIACLQGLSPSIASYEVPIVTTGCVMRCLVFCLLFHGATTALYYVLSDSSLFSLLGEATGLW